MKPIINQIILFIGIILIYISLQSNNKIKVIESPKPKTNNISVPVNNNIDIPVLYDDYKTALKLSDTHKKRLLLIFHTDWCPYCKDLKKDISILYNKQIYIVCFINTEINKDIARQYKIKNLPTSIIIYNNKELSIFKGYNKTSYIDWLAKE